MGTRVGTALLLPLLAGAVLTGCDDAPAARPAASAHPAATPTALGGPRAAETSPPSTPMDDLERPVHRRLAAQISGQGLTLTYLDCPRWDGTVPTRMVCKGYVDGLVARRKLERTLRRQGWTRADCGDVPAYPAKVGSRIVCHVHRGGDDRYVVATVSDRSGAVMIGDYRGST